MCTPKRYVEVLNPPPPGTYECGLFGNTVFEDVLKVKMKS